MAAEFGGVKQYVYCTLRGLVGVDAADGKILWEFPWRFNVAVAPSPLVIDNERVFMTSLYNADSVMFRVERGDDGEFQTEKLFEMPPSKWNSEVHTPILFNEHMFAVGKKQRGLFTCLDLDGNIVWTSPARKTAFGLGSFLLADGLFQERLNSCGADLVTRPLGTHPALARLVAERFRDATIRSVRMHYQRTA